MAQLPSGPKKDIFSLSYDGVYGRFKTEESFELGYLLTTLRAHELNALETASKAFNFRTITFDEIIQRDIDMERVDNELVKDYLEKGKGKVLFFPPILVSVVAVENGVRVDNYKTVTTAGPAALKAPLIQTTWDIDKFQLELNTVDSPTGYEFEVEGVKHQYIPYAATLRVNPQTVKLVVIDGQHRFMALKRILDDSDKKHLLSEMGVPVCMFFTPDAVQAGGQGESINRDLRELFVTINSTAKEVSGHFIVLLNDKSLSSLTVRSLANDWKEAEASTLLPLLEWNTREASKSRQRQKTFSITTVTTIADCFEKYIYARPEVVEDILNLSAIRQELKVSETSPAYNEISEETFAAEQIDILRDRLKDWVTPALNVLFRKPRPYSGLVASYRKALATLEEKVQQNTTGAKFYRDEVLFQFRRTAKNDWDPAKVAESEFEAAIVISEYDQVFFLNLFQQGLMRVWATLSKSVVKIIGEKPSVIAQAMIPVLESGVFNSTKEFWTRSNSYLQPLLFEGQKLRVNESARLQWHNLILATFYTSEARESLGNAFASLVAPGKQQLIEAAVGKIAELAEGGLVEYLEALEARLLEDYKRNWRFKDLDDEVDRYLREREGVVEAHTEFLDKLNSLVAAKMGDARIALSNMLGVKLEDLPAS